jgi:hypothetical protein
LKVEILSARVLEIVGEGELAVVEIGCSKRGKLVNVGEECVVEVSGGAQGGMLQAPPIAQISCEPYIMSGFLVFLY